VLEHEELGEHAVDLERREAAVASDAVILVHDRRADAQVRQLANDGFGVPDRAASALALPWSLHAELLGREHAQLRPGKPDSRLELAYGDAEAVIAFDERAPAGQRLRRIAAA